MQTLTDEQLLDLIHNGGAKGLSAPVYQSPLELLRQELGSDDLGLVEHYLTTGTRSAINETRDALKPYIHVAIYNAKQASTNPTWDVALHGMELSAAYSLQVTMKQAWNFGTVLHEIGSMAEDRRKVRYHFESMLNNKLPEYDKRLDANAAPDSYWRGVGLLTALNDDFRLSPYDMGASRIAKRFINWAGAHEDIALVYRTVLERETLDIDVLQQIIFMTVDAPSLGLGVL